MAHESFLPQQPSEALQGYGAVLLNHGGSRVRQDTGRDADALAQALGIPVLAIDRPGTGTWRLDSETARFLSTPNGYKGEIGELGNVINTGLKEAGVERSLVMGRSAGGLGALALTAAGVVESQVAVYAAEPVGCKQQTVAAGRQQFGVYNSIQSMLQESEPDLIKPAPPGLGPIASLGRLASMGPDNLVDRFHNRKIWASDAATRYMKTVAEGQPATDMTVEFASFSMMVDDKLYAKLAGELTQIRDGIHLERVADTTHASFDNREFMAQRTQRVFDRLLAAN